ncbi:MAG: ATP-grasp domain-containing protein, partial [bacterium]
MRLYEYEGKMLFKRNKIPIPDGVVIDRNSISELEKVVYPVVIKAQAFLGGRGKAGMIQFAHNRAEAEQKINDVIGKKHGSYVIEKVLIERKIDIEQELYIAALIDRIEHKPLLMLSTKGGVDIEDIAKADPQLIKKYYFIPGEKLSEYKARLITGELGFHGEVFSNLSTVIFN